MLLSGQKRFQHFVPSLDRNIQALCKLLKIFQPCMTVFFHLFRFKCLPKYLIEFGFSLYNRLHIESSLFYPDGIAPVGFVVKIAMKLTAGNTVSFIEFVQFKGNRV
jgi:hypothetical protein